jgi:hypothetical protein
VIFRRHIGDSHTDTVAGSSQSGIKDGSIGEALFASPSGMLCDDRNGRWLVADSLNHCVRCIELDSFLVTTVPSPLFSKVSSLPPVSARTMPPMQLSHSPLKQNVFLSLRRLTAELHLPLTLSHLLEWAMTGVNVCRSKFGLYLSSSVSFQQFTDMSRFFRFSDINALSHVPMWRPHRIFSDGAGGFVVISLGRFVVEIVGFVALHMLTLDTCFVPCSLFAWHFKASSTWDAVDHEVLKISRQHGLLAIEAALLSAALADAKTSICLRGSLYKLDATSSSDPEAPRIKLLKTGVFDGAVSPSGQEYVSFGPSAIHVPRNNLH